MKDDDDKLKGGHVLRLIRETLDGLGQLVVQHLKLAQLELKADLQEMASRLGLVAACVVLMFGGYFLTMVGLACLLGGDRTLAFSFLGIGMAHVLGSALGIRILLGRLRRAHLMTASAGEISQSAAAMVAAVSPKTLPASTKPVPAEQARLERARVG